MSVKEQSSSATGVLTVPPLDAPAVARAVRDELRRRARQDGFTAAQFHADLQAATENARVGLALPEMSRYHGLRRRLVRLLCRGLLYAARLITRPQSVFNLSVLRSLQTLATTSERIAREQEQLRLAQEMFARLDEVMATRVGALEKALADLEAARGWP